MAYRLVTNRDNYSDLASGFVFRSAPGFPAFPVRLAQEVYLRSASYLPETAPVGLWDPCCGSGYLACVVALLNRDRLRHLLCSDIDEAALTIARRNLGMLTDAGLSARRRELREHAAAYGKAHHLDASRATERLQVLLRDAGGDLAFDTHVADAFDPHRLSLIMPTPAPDLVLTDVPYGQQTVWHGIGGVTDQPLVALVRSLCQVLPDHTIIAMCARTRKISLGHGIRVLERFRIGARATIIARVEQLRGLV